MRKIGLIIISTIFCFLPIFAQELQVKTFENVLTDVSASTNIRTDGNGDICSLVKVRLAEENASFEGNIVDDVSFKHGEYWVYMTAGSKNLLVQVKGFLPIDVKFPNYGINALEGKQTYVLTLLSSPKEVEIKQELKIRVVPEDAIVLIDGDVVSLRKGIADVSLPVGSHSYNIAKEGYIKQMGEIRLFPDVPAKLIVELDKNNFSTEGNSTEVTNPSDETRSLLTTQRMADLHNGHVFVDMGLSVKWATCNVGASIPEEFGNYYAWGETEPQDNNIYNWDSYKWCKNGYEYAEYAMTKYCKSSPNGFLGMVDNKDTLEPADDAASVNWGGAWRMPTIKEMDELRKKCKWEWISSNGIWGYKITSKKNGNFIFLPAADHRSNNSNNIDNSWGCYWSSSLGTSNTACELNFYSEKISKADFRYRCNGLSVRAVCP